MIALKKILLFMLVICTLGYGSAWAYDGHAVELNSDASVVLDAAAVDIVSHSAGESDSEHAPDTSTDCDHCAHISAHLMAIFSQSGYLCSVNQSSELLELSETFVSLIVSPDLRPPRV